MPRIIETTVFTIDELSGAAKENAHIWYRDQGLHNEWYDFVYDDFEAICKILGVTLATTPVRLYGGGTRDKPLVWFSGYADNRTMPRSLPKPLIFAQSHASIVGIFIGTQGTPEACLQACIGHSAPQSASSVPGLSPSVSCPRGDRCSW